MLVGKSEQQGQQPVAAISPALVVVPWLDVLEVGLASGHSTILLRHVARLVLGQVAKQLPQAIIGNLVGTTQLVAAVAEARTHSLPCRVMVVPWALFSPSAFLRLGETSVLSGLQVVRYLIPAFDDEETIPVPLPEIFPDTLESLTGLPIGAKAIAQRAGQLALCPGWQQEYLRYPLTDLEELVVVRSVEFTRHPLDHTQRYFHLEALERLCFGPADPSGRAQVFLDYLSSLLVAILTAPFPPNLNMHEEGVG